MGWISQTGGQFFVLLIEKCYEAGGVVNLEGGVVNLEGGMVAWRDVLY